MLHFQGKNIDCIIESYFFLFWFLNATYFEQLIFHLTAKNGVYITLVRDVRHAFEGSPLVKIDCRGMHASDYKKLGAKLKVCRFILCFLVFIFFKELHQSLTIFFSIVVRNWFLVCYCPSMMNRYWCGGDQTGNQSTNSLYLQILLMTVQTIWIL